MLLERRTPSDVVHAIAGSRGGRYLSVDTQSKRTKVTLECKLGHTWQASLNSVKQGSWCPECTRLERKNARGRAAGEQATQALHKGPPAQSTTVHVQGDQPAVNAQLPRMLTAAHLVDASSPLHITLRRLHEKAKRLGWCCLSQVWEGYYARYAFECVNGHSQTCKASQFLFRKQHCRPRCPDCEAQAREEHGADQA